MKTGEEIIADNMKALEAADESGEELKLPYPDADSVKEPEKPVEGEEAEVVAEVKEEEKEPESEAETVEVDEIAEKDGYMSKEDWIASGKPEEDYMSKEDFAKVGELRDGGETRQQLAKKLVQMEASLKDVVTNQRSMIDDAKEQTRQTLLAELQEKKKEAIEFQDAEGAAKIERDIVKAENDKPAEVQDEVSPEVKSWYDSNSSWYQVDAAATGALNVQLQKHEAAGLPFEEAIPKAMEVVKKHFPYHFDGEAEAKPKEKEIPTRVTARAVETSQKKAESKKTRTFADIEDAEERKIAKAGAKMANMTEEKYMENYS